MWIILQTFYKTTHHNNLNLTTKEERKEVQNAQECKKDD